MERRVVITGLGAVTPVGNDVETFWENLKAGKCGITEITKFDSTDYKAHVAAEVKDFDPLLYMDKGELRKSDLFAQFAMAAATQAVNDSEILGKIDPERFGVYFGSGIGGIQTFSNQMTVLNEKGPKRISAYFIPMLIANIAGGNIAIKFNAQGSCLPITTACATSNNEIGEAYRAIKHGYLDAIIAGGSEAAISPIGVAGFGNMTALTPCPDPAEACCPFDKRRSGFVMGEGGAALILEEYEHAKARGARIYAEIVGYGATDDAHHMTAPDPEGNGGARAIRMAYEEAGADIANEKIYINAHGTSTPLNERSETVAIKKAFDGHVENVVVSSTKSMTGHMLGAAGAVEAIASALAVREGIVPPTINYKEPDPECDLDVCPNVARKMDIDLALSVSLGFGGHNACIAIRKVL